MNSNKLYVGNLSYQATEEGLSELFSGAGNVSSAKIITDRATGRSKGFGFVEMASSEEAEKAAEMFNGFNFEGRNLVVNEAKPLEKKSYSDRKMTWRG